MSAHHLFPTADQRRKPSWFDLLKIARTSPAFAAAAINELREQAQALADRKGVPTDRINQAIADAAQGYLDCICDDCLDEIEALMDPGPRCELEAPWHKPDRYLVDLGYRAGRGW